jgi:hypothetical protein
MVQSCPTQDFQVVGEEHSVERAEHFVAGVESFVAQLFCEAWSPHEGNLLALANDLCCLGSPCSEDHKRRKKAQSCQLPITSPCGFPKCRVQHLKTRERET